MQLSTTGVSMSLIVSCCLATSFKKVKSKVTFPSIGLLSEVPANDTEVFESPSRPRFFAPSRVAGLACCPIHAANSLLTKEACAPVSKRVEALNGGPLFTKMQHSRYDVIVISFLPTVEQLLAYSQEGCE